jgi:hypothetical protein
MSALPPKANIAKCDLPVRFVPKAEVIKPTGRRRTLATSAA